jgi:hypothetical protein
MPYNFIGRVLFPKHPAWKQKREAKIIVIAVSAALLFAGIIAAVMLLQGGRRF